MAPIFKPFIMYIIQNIHQFKTATGTDREHVSYFKKIVKFGRFQAREMTVNRDEAAQFPTKHKAGLMATSKRDKIIKY